MQETAKFSREIADETVAEQAYIRTKSISSFATIIQVSPLLRIICSSKKIVCIYLFINLLKSSGMKCMQFKGMCSF